MIKTILITGATDGIGLEAAKMLAAKGHTLLLHGRSAHKLEAAVAAVSNVPGAGAVESYSADLSDLNATAGLAQAVAEKHDHLDVLINNAGVLKTPQTIAPNGMDIRFVVNTLAPYLLTKKLLPLMNGKGRVVNLSSAAQGPVNIEALTSGQALPDMEAYAQSKLAITMWSRVMAEELRDTGPLVVAVNPGSLLASKMVKEGFGVEGKDLGIGADILTRAALSDEFVGRSGQYFDNDAGRFAAPHPDALDDGKAQAVTKAVADLVG